MSRTLISSLLACRLFRLSFLQLFSLSHTHARTRTQYYRPTEVDRLIGNPAKAKERLGWQPRITFMELVKEMVDADLQLMRTNPLA